MNDLDLVGLWIEVTLSFAPVAERHHPEIRPFEQSRNSEEVGVPAKASG